MSYLISDCPHHWQLLGSSCMWQTKFRRSLACGESLILDGLLANLTSRDYVRIARDLGGSVKASTRWPTLLYLLLQSLQSRDLFVLISGTGDS
jgi:hypothetical protein